MRNKNLGQSDLGATRITYSSVARANRAPPRVALLCFVAMSALVDCPSFAPEKAKPTISFATDDQGRKAIDLRGIDEEIAALAQKGDKRFAIYAVFEAELADQPPLAGQYRAVNGALRFTPRFPLEPGMKYRALYRETPESKPQIVADFSVPDRPAGPAARVAAIYPSAGVLPQNQLKFYLHFTAPMSRGDAYQRLRLIDACGALVDLPFLELAEELWNPAGDRLTLLLDPARVKQQLKAREEAGPVLVTGNRYSLVVDRGFCDAAGQPLTDEFRKTFRVAEADETCPDPRLWRLTVPRAGTELPLEVDFGESLDHALLQRMLWIVDRRGEQVAGQTDIGKDETSWRFLPRNPWQPGRYRLVADTSLEDLAGNSIARKFELDGRKGTKPPSEDATVEVEFLVEE